MGYQAFLYLLKGKDGYAFYLIGDTMNGLFTCGSGGKKNLHIRLTIWFDFMKSGLLTETLWLMQ